MLKKLLMLTVESSYKLKHGVIIVLGGQGNMNNTHSRNIPFIKT